jgi:tRNA modification GTPase
MARFMSDDRTDFAVLTPGGAAAIATIALSGSDALQIARRLFRPAGRLAAPPPTDTFWHGRFGGPPGDEVVVATRGGGGRPQVEVHCHGGPEVVRMICNELAAAGASSADAERFTGVKPVAARAIAELARAPTLRTAAILLDQFQGAFDNAIVDIAQALAASDLSRSRRLLADLNTSAALGRHLVKPWRVVVAGAPNVGKSSLVNALAGYERCVVTSVPGTTRDVLATSVAIDGWPVELIDTAGQHVADDGLEVQGIARAQTEAAAADLCLWVVDGSASPIWPRESPANVLIVVNKTDLPAAWDRSALTGSVTTSAVTDAGMAELSAAVSRRLVSDPPPPGVAVPFTAELADRMLQVERYVAENDLSAARAALRAIADSPQPMSPG